MRGTAKWPKGQCQRVVISDAESVRGQSQAGYPRGQRVSQYHLQDIQVLMHASFFQIIKDGEEHADLNEVAKLFNIHED